LADEAINLAIAATECWITRGITEAMNRFNRRSGDAPAAKPVKKTDAPTEGPKPTSGENN
jgi:hypothetical protein